MSPDVATVELSLAQIRYLSAFVWVQLDEDPNDPFARALFQQLKEATVRLGAVWNYGDLPLRPSRPKVRSRGERLPGGTWVIREGRS